MKIRACLMLLVLEAFAAAGAKPADVAELGWLAGCWARHADGLVYEEQWMAPAGGVMLGMSRTIARGRAVASEYLRIDTREGTDSLQYTAMPSGQSLTVFTASLIEPRHVVFENPAHDFPQRIIYRLDGDTLSARIEGTQAGKPRAADFIMQRASCPG